MKIGSNKISFVCISLSIALTQASTSYGQLNGLGFGKSSGTVTVDKGAFLKSTDEVTGNVLTARITFLESKATLMEALGLKNDSVVKASEALRAKEGPTSSSDDKVAALKDSSKTTADADKQFDAALNQSNELSAESKAKFAQGTGKFILGVILEKEQIDTIQKLVEQGKALSSSANPFEKIKVIGLVKPVMTLSTIVPGDVATGTSTLGKIMKFCKTQKITEIPNSDKATASLGDLN